MKALAAAARVAALVFILAAPFSAYAGPVNINTADAETLANELEGVGITKARAIVAYRNANGPFTTAEALTEVTGIGARTIEVNRANILLEDSEGVADNAR
ncbi:MAG: helix-hairpin-helix domain-containing protein [Pseudomonadota bacterium]